MDQKIAWYQEILELEPSSKIFFPLARLLVRDGYANLAIDVLRNGLAHHKDFFEARLLLIELLHSTGDETACDAEVRILLALFSDYPKFWTAWGASLAHDGAQNDVSLAMRFIAASQKCSDISFASLLDKGLQTLEKSSFVPPTQDSVFGHENTFDIDDRSLFDFAPQCGDASELEDAPLRTELVQAMDYADFLMQSGQGSSVDEDFALGEMANLSPNVDVAVEHDVATLLANQESGSMVLNALSDTDSISLVKDSIYLQNTKNYTDEIELLQSIPLYSDVEHKQETKTEEMFTLRTRSMAEVLLSQGDVLGALSIYQELLLSEKNEASRHEIQDRIDALRHNKNCCDVVDAEHEPCHGKEKLLQMLTLLAERLDSRAQ